MWLLLLLLAPSRAEGYTLLGGETLDVMKNALHIQVGYPEVDARYHIPILKNFEVAPRLTLYYAHGFAGGALQPGVLGNTLGVILRWTLFSKKRFHLAFRAAPALFVTYVGTGEPVVGFRLGVPGGLAMDWDVSQEVRIVAGVSLPVLLTGAPGLALAVPIDMRLGAEVALTEEMNLSVLLEAGPAVIAAPGVDTYVGTSLRGMIGIEYLL